MLKQRCLPVINWPARLPIRLGSLVPRRNGAHWQITGNEAAALRAPGGVRFAAVYPITPATDLSGGWLHACTNWVGI
ncbi:MAG: hypothetical protein R3F37_19830 [Candidatus Competibacteraceae bacterium]